MILLTDEEIDLYLLDPDTINTKESYHNLLKAQLEKMAEWGESYSPICNRPQRECSHCWQALLDNIK